MQRSIAVILALNLSVGALANYCHAGQKHKDDLTGLKCIMGAEDATSCASECCEKDPKKCGGRSTPPACSSDSYFGSDFATQHTAAATKEEADKVCCKKKATCSEAACPAGFIKDATYSKILCASDAKSCLQNSFCCKPNMLTCGGRIAAEGEPWKTRAGEFAAAGGNGVTGGSFTAADLTGANPAAQYYIPSTAQQTTDYKNKVVKADGTDKVTQCAVKRENCKKATYTCPAGLKKPTAAGGATTQLEGLAQTTGFPKFDDASICPSDAASCIQFCCVKDDSTCGGLSLGTAKFDAGSSYFVKKGTPTGATDFGCDAATTFTPAPADVGTWDIDNQEVIDQKEFAKAWAAKAAGKDAAAWKAACCLPKPTCASHTCPAGKKTKTGLAAGTKCGTSQTCTANCCEDDLTSCGGIAATSGFSCKYGFFNEMDSWTSKTTQATMDIFNGKNATAATAGTLCCTPRVPCAIPGTSTPAPAVVTTTPAAAALKFSEHKIAVDATQSSGMNMLWLGVGALVGMAVLMVVQGLRSKSQAADPTQSDDDADALLNTNVE